MKPPILRFLCILCLCLINQLTFSQSASFSKQLPLDTLLSDKRVAIIRKLLPEGWQMTLKGTNFYIEHKEKVWFPSRSLLLDDASNVLPYRYEYRQGKKILVVEMSPCFRFQVDDKWPQQKMADTLRYNDELFLKEGVRSSKLKKVPTHMTEKYSLFLLAAYDFREYLPDNIYNQMITLHKQIGQFWKIEYK